MKDGACPKCGSNEIHVVSNTATEVAIAIKWSSTAYLTYYVCTECGYVELYVKDKHLLPRIAEKYPKV